MTDANTRLERSIIEASVLLMTLPYVIASIAKNPTAFATSLTPGAISFGLSLLCAVYVISSDLPDFGMSPAGMSPGWFKFFRRLEFTSFQLGVVYLLYAFFVMSWTETKVGEIALFIFALAVLAVVIYCLCEYRDKRKNKSDNQSPKP